jgi:hypothetical protein
LAKALPVALLLRVDGGREGGAGALGEVR